MRPSLPADARASASAPRAFPIAPMLLVMAAVLLGLALQVADGFYAPPALALVTASLAATAVGVAVMPRAAQAFRPTPAVAVAAVGIAVQIALLLRAVPGMYLQPGAALWLFRTGVAAEAALIAIGVTRSTTLRRIWFPALLLVHILLGIWMIRASPDPRIDVVTVHRAAIRALLHGRSPYAITFQNIYGPGAPFYNPALVQDGRVMFGYPYPPLTLLLAVPGQACCGDYRYAEVAATAGAAAAIAYSGGTLAPMAAAVFLTTPRMFFVVEQGWTEPMAVLMVALAVWTMKRKVGAAAWMAGLMLATKQYLALAAPPVVRWSLAAARRVSPETSSANAAVRLLARAAVAGALVTLPFIVWNARAFIETVVLLQAREPFRIDSLSYLSWAARQGWGVGSIAWSVAAGLAALAVAMWRTPNTAAGFAATLAFSSLATFAFGSKAFCNYYFFVVGVLCCAVAALDGARSG